MSVITWILILSVVVLFFLVRAKLDSTMKRIFLPLVATLLIMGVFGVFQVEFILLQFFSSMGMYLNPLVSLIFQVVVAFGIYFGIYFIVNKRRAANHQISLNELKKSDEITRNGIVINIEDETEEYSVKKCPYCQEEINKEATKCKHCGERVGKGYEIIADGTYVANKLQGEWTSGQSSENKKSGNLFFRVVWITLTVLIVILLFNTAILTTFLGAIFG